MTLIIVLFAVGLVLLLLEVILPGGVIGILGGIVMAVSVGLVFARYGASAGMYALAGAVVIAVGSVMFELWWLPRSKWAAQFTVRDTAGSTPTPPAPPEIVGKRGRALTTLAPTGYVEIEGRTYEAASSIGLLAKGDAVVVESFDQFKLTVTRTSSS